MPVPPGNCVVHVLLFYTKFQVSGSVPVDRNPVALFKCFLALFKGCERLYSAKMTTVVRSPWTRAFRCKFQIVCLVDVKKTQLQQLLFVVVLLCVCFANLCWIIESFFFFIPVRLYLFIFFYLAI